MPKRIIVLEPPACGQECTTVRQMFSTEPGVEFVAADSEQGQRISVGMGIAPTSKPLIITISEEGVTVNEQPPQ